MATITDYRPPPSSDRLSTAARCISLPGHYQPHAEQPVWFDEPKFFMDHDNVSLGKPGTSGRFDMSLYASFTVRNGKSVLWYPGSQVLPSRPGRSATSGLLPLLIRHRLKTGNPNVIVYLPKEGNQHDGDNENVHRLQGAPQRRTSGNVDAEQRRRPRR